LAVIGEEVEKKTEEAATATAVSARGHTARTTTTSAVRRMVTFMVMEVALPLSRRAGRELARLSCSRRRRRRRRRRLFPLLGVMMATLLLLLHLLLLVRTKAEEGVLSNSPSLADGAKLQLLLLQRIDN
jgi:hypothetical protein